MVEAVGALCAENADRLILARSSADIKAACTGSGRIAAISSLEGADPLKGDPLALAPFYRAGVRLVALAWADNAFCGTTTNPFSNPVGGNGSGLTRKGQDLVGNCEELGVVVDVSHASDRAFWDVCAVSTKPFVASHSDCGLSALPRNLTDDMIKAIGERGGVVGVNLYPGFFSPAFFAAEEEVRRASSRRGAAGGGDHRIEPGPPSRPLSLVFLVRRCHWWWIT